MKNQVKSVLKSALVAAVLGAITTANAADSVATTLIPVTPSCAAGDLVGSGFSFMSCAGFYSGNFITGNANDKLAVNNVLTGLGLLGTGGTFLEKLDFGSGSTIDFATVLSGITYIGIHRGGAGDGEQRSAFYKLNVTSDPVFTFTLGGLSNAAVYKTAAAIPEPETYALMLAGLGVVGFIARRRKQQA